MLVDALETSLTHDAVKDCPGVQADAECLAVPGNLRVEHLTPLLLTEAGYRVKNLLRIHVAIRHHPDELAEASLLLVLDWPFLHGPKWSISLYCSFF